MAKSRNIIIAVDIRSKLACYQKGAMGNYASAISISCKEESDDVFKQAKAIHQQIQLSLKDNKKLMAIFACYLSMEPSLIDAAAIASTGDFDSKSGRFVGKTILGYEKRVGISITNLGSAECDAMQYAMFIPPASPATQTNHSVCSF